MKTIKDLKKEIKKERLSQIEAQKFTNSPMCNIRKRIKEIEDGDMGYGNLPFLKLHLEVLEGVVEKIEKINKVWKMQKEVKDLLKELRGEEQ